MTGLKFLLVFLFIIGSELSWPVASFDHKYTRGKCLINRYSSWRFRNMPQYATMFDVHDYDFRLNDMSIEAYEMRYERTKDFLETLNKIEPNETDPVEIINLKVLRYELETFVNFYPFKGFYLALNEKAGPQRNLKRVFGKMPLETFEDFELLLKRMKKIPRQLDQIIELLKAGVEANITIHTTSASGVTTSLKKIVQEDAALSTYYSFFDKTMPTSLTSEQISSLQTTAKKIINDKLNPAFEKLVAYLENEYVPRTDISISSINNGQGFYSALLLYHTSTGFSAQEMHDLGLAEVKRIETEIGKIKEEMGHSGLTLIEFDKLVKTDPKNQFATPEEMLASLNHLIDNVIAPNLTNIISKIPTAKMKIEEINYYNGPYAYYSPGSLNITKPGVFKINTGYIGKPPKYLMLSHTLHGYLGHHFEMSHVLESEDYPLYRKVADVLNMIHAPSTFPVYTEFSDGWAMYSETLGFEMNLYGDPLDRYGLYLKSQLRACQVVVDTGIHALGWSQQTAVQYFMSYLPIETNEAESYVQRSITLPGQSISQKIGHLKVEQIRDKAKGILGDKFNLKEFNDVVFESYGPLTLVEEEVMNWANKKLLQ